jgi:hypothetical protein
MVRLHSPNRLPQARCRPLPPVGKPSGKLLLLTQLHSFIMCQRAAAEALQAHVPMLS